MWSAETVFVCALALLGRSEQSFPTVQFIEKAPIGVSPRAQAYVLDAEKQIILITSTSAFKQARRTRDRCGDLEALQEIAAVLAHEEWHVRHGADEEGAYNAQLIALVYVGANQDGRLFHSVMRSKLAVGEATKRAAEARVMARATPSRRDEGP